MLIAASVGGRTRCPTSGRTSPSTPSVSSSSGDPKQSIYRFRRASIGLFLDARDRFSTEAVRLTHELPDGACARRLGEPGVRRPDGGGTARPAAEVRAARPPTGRSTRRGIACSCSDGPHAKDERLRAGVLRELEAATVADAVAGILDAPGDWPVEDGDGWRPARPEDIAILLPTRTSLTTLTDALRSRGVEFRAETGTLVYETQEIRDLIVDPARGRPRCRRGRARRGVAVTDPGLRRRRPRHLRRRRRSMGSGRGPCRISDPDPSGDGGARLPRRAPGGAVVDGTERADRADRPRPAGDDARVRRAACARRVAPDPVPRRPGAPVRGVAVGRPRRVRRVVRPPALRHGAGPRAAAARSPTTTRCAS